MFLSSIFKIQIKIFLYEGSPKIGTILRLFSRKLRHSSNYAWTYAKREWGGGLSRVSIAYYALWLISLQFMQLWVKRHIGRLEKIEKETSGWKGVLRLSNGIHRGFEGSVATSTRHVYFEVDIKRARYNQNKLILH